MIGRIFLLAVLASSCAPTLSGQLVSSDGSAVVSKEGKVNVTSLSSNLSYVVQVNEDGSWEVDEDLPKGEVLVEAMVPGYKLASEKADLSQTDQMRFRLERLGPVSTAPIGANLNGDVGRGAGGATLTPPKL